MKKSGWFYLSLALIGMIWHDVAWSRGHKHFRGHAGYSHSRFVGKQNIAFGAGYRASFFGHRGHFGYRNRNVGFYGGFAYGRPFFPHYRGPFYRSYGYFGDPFFWPAYPPVYPPVVVVPATPPVYIQQSPAVTQSAPVSPVITTTDYWYYCENPAGYYPEVKNCPDGWVQVPPRPAQ